MRCLFNGHHSSHKVRQRHTSHQDYSGHFTCETTWHNMLRRVPSSAILQLSSLSTLLRQYDNPARPSHTHRTEKCLPGVLRRRWSGIQTEFLFMMKATVLTHQRLPLPPSFRASCRSWGLYHRWQKLKPRKIIFSRTAASS